MHQRCDALNQLTTGEDFDNKGLSKYVKTASKTTFPKS